MRIYVRNGKLRLFFWLPLSFLKGKLAGKILTELFENNSAKNKKEKTETDSNFDALISITQEDCDDVAAVDVEQTEPEPRDDLQGKTGLTIEFCKFIEESNNSDKATPDETSETNEPAEETAEIKPKIDKEFLKKVYSVLKEVVKNCGHFTMVDVLAENEGEGKTRVKITI